MKDLVQRIAQALVDNTEQVSVVETEGEQTTVLELKVAKEDIGQVGGKQGRNAEAIRIILSAASAKANKHSILEIIQEAKNKNDRQIADQFQSKIKTHEKGTVKWFNDKKGYGFIEKDGGMDIFVHYSSIKGAGYKTLREGDRVTFDVEQDAKGIKALNVNKISFRNHFSAP